MTKFTVLAHRLGIAAVIRISKREVERKNRGSAGQFVWSKKKRGKVVLGGEVKKTSPLETNRSRGTRKLRLQAAELMWCHKKKSVKEHSL